MQDSVKKSAERCHFAGVGTRAVPEHNRQQEQQQVSANHYQLAHGLRPTRIKLKPTKIQTATNAAWPSEESKKGTIKIEIVG